MLQLAPTPRRRRRSPSSARSPPSATSRAWPAVDSTEASGTAPSSSTPFVTTPSVTTRSATTTSVTGHRGTARWGTARRGTGCRRTACRGTAWSLAGIVASRLLHRAGASGDHRTRRRVVTPACRPTVPESCQQPSSDLLCFPVGAHLAGAPLPALTPAEGQAGLNCREGLRETTAGPESPRVPTSHPPFIPAWDG